MHFVQAPLIALMVVILDERFDLSFEVTGQKVVFQQYAILECLVPAFDFTLGLQVGRGTVHMTYLLICKIISLLVSHMTWTVVDNH